MNTEEQGCRRVPVSAGSVGHPELLLCRKAPEKGDLFLSQRNKNTWDSFSKRQKNESFLEDKLEKLILLPSSWIHVVKEPPEVVFRGFTSG